jgi:excisionase family DNA binding protein
LGRTGYDRRAAAALLTAAEVGKRLRLPLSTVYYLAKAGKLKGFRVGRSWRFPESEIDRLQKTELPTALIVHADESLRRLVATALEPRGCRVEHADSARDALAMARRMTFDVLFVDLRLPDGTGTDLIRALRDDYGLDQMVLISALPDLASSVSLSGIEGIALLPKPPSQEGVRACVERVTGRPLSREGTAV